MRHTEKRQMEGEEEAGEDAGRDQSYTARLQGSPGATGSWPHKEGFSTRAWLTDTLISDFWSLEL